jgi:PAS domain-containing protein
MKKCCCNCNCSCNKEALDFATSLDNFDNPSPIPVDFPTAPELPNWWLCRRLGPVSGRYYGEMTSPNIGKYELDLRVDIDPRYDNSPVMKRVSGDIYRVYSFNLPGLPPRKWRVYQKSWIVDNPNAVWSKCQVKITGAIRFWKENIVPKLQVIIPWGSFRPAGPADVQIQYSGGVVESYSCARKSDSFRDMTLEVDICNSVNAAPFLPSYDTSSLPGPSQLPQRTLTVQEAYREAGVNVTIRPNNTIIDDSAAQFNTWSVSELHDAMETHFSQFGSSWPNWQMWGLLAGKFDSAGTLGIMFDAAAMYGGAGENPDRQGFAIFRKHPSFNNLVPAPSTEAEFDAMRDFLYTWVHEAGHAFNFLHSWNKGRPQSLSWMNYPQYVSNFWEKFEFRFDDEELIHLRHGDRASVIMGGDPWASGGHLEDTSGDFSILDGDAPVEFLIRSKEYFEFMEPIFIELRLRNLLDNIPLHLDTRLSPEHGGVIIYIRRPNGRTLEYNPATCQISDPQIQVLKSSQNSVQGEDRYSEEIFLGYGKYGFYFDEPGEYLIRAVYQGTGDILIPSNTHRIRIGRPFSKYEDTLAQDFFSYQVGMSLYLSGSQSHHLSKGMGLLEEIANNKNFKDTFLAIKAASTVANSVGRSFFSIVKGEEKVLTRTQTHKADPNKALELTSTALNVYKKKNSKALNLGYHKLVQNRIDCLLSQNETDKAKQEVDDLCVALHKAGANQPVLKRIKDAFTEKAGKNNK